MKYLIKQSVYLVVLLCSALLLLSSLGCDLAGDTEDDSDTEVTSTLELTGFTYSGTNDVYFTLYGSEGPGNGTAPVHSQKISDGISGEDIVFDDLNIEEHEDEGERVQLYIASDENGSGDPDAGDYIMPIFRFDLYYGEYRRIPFLDLDTATSYQAGPLDNDRVRFYINYGQLGPVNESTRLILLIKNAGDFDFSVPGNEFKIIPLTDKGFITEIEFFCSFPDDTYHFLLFHDNVNVNGVPDIGEASSTTDPINNVQDSFTVAGGADYDIELTVSQDTALY